MTTCASCGAPAGADDRFCGRCGAELAAAQPAAPTAAGFCTSCGAALDPDDRFCGQCGAPARAAEPEPEEDLLADWDLEVPEDEAEEIVAPLPKPDEAVTESIQRTPKPSDTAVIPQAAEPVRPLPAPVVPAPPAAEARRPSRGFPLGATVALLGAVAVIVSAVLEWNGPFAGELPRDIAVRLLLDPTGPATGLNLGVVLLGIGTAGALVAILTMASPALKPLRRLMGLVALAVPAGFAVRTAQLALESGAILDLPGLLGPGVYVAAIGAFVELVAGKWFGR